MAGSMQRRVFWTFIVMLACRQGLAEAPKAVMINEFMASNTYTLADAGKFDDWIELYNGSSQPVDVAGMYLTDKLADPAKWQFPEGQPSVTTIPALSYLVIWADGDTQASGLHAGFSLSADGEELGLFDVDGTLIDRIVFGGQFADVSYGRWPDGNDAWQYMGTPTPGKANKQGYLCVVADVEVSPHRGFYDAPFSVTITTETPDATIFYTLDGGSPLDPQGNTQIYYGPILITTTTCLRAVALQEGWKPSNVETQTYLFLKDVIGQPKKPAGFPTSWADYEMAQDITASPAYGPLMEEALLSLPSLSVVMNKADLFGANGINANPNSRGPAWERPTSVELIYPDGRQGFQINCGIQIQGGAFRTMTPKHSFRLSFKGIYGATKLRYPLFGDDAVDEFDTITLRAGANDGYSWNAARYTEQYTRDEFGRDLQRATGNVGSHGTFVHLYVDGLYWGLYNPVERPDASFSASYLGGDKGDWDALHNGGSTEAVQGDLNAWNQMITLCGGGLTSNEAYQRLQGNNPDGTPNPAFPNLLDVTNYIDYLILNVWGGNWDWPGKNWYAARDRSAQSTGFKFYCWDFENTMGNNLSRSPLNMVTPDQGLYGTWNAGLGVPHYYLRQNAEYRLLFADRVHRFLFNGGVLTPESLIPRYQALAASVELAIIGESARWGDLFYHPPLTLEDWYDRDSNYNDGRAGRDWILKYYLPQRTAIVLQQFKDAGLYPSIEAPAFQIDGTDQFGGEARSGAVLTMVNSNASGVIYYTLDGSDPRLPDNSPQQVPTVTLVAENAPKRVWAPTQDIGTAWRGGSEPFDDSGWTDGTPMVSGKTGGVGYDRETTYLPFITYDVLSAMYNKMASCYIRIPFTVKAQDLAIAKTLTLRARCDDGFVAFLNGVEVASVNRPATLTWNSTCANRPDSTDFVDIDISASVSALRSGDNVLAVQAINTSTASSDFLFSTELIGGGASGSGQAKISPSAMRYTGPVTLQASASVKARAWTNQWSALSEAVYAIGPVGGSPGY